MAPIIDYRGQFSFRMTPSEVWDAIEHTEQFEGWWPWLHEFSLDGPTLSPGAVLRGVVDPPIPYLMRLDVVLTRCDRPTELDANVHGDLEGPAQVRLLPSAGGTTAEVSWRLEMMQRPMRLASRFAHPLMQWGHDRVVEMTVSGFRRRVEAAR
jgi:hypothetical protein